MVRLELPEAIVRLTHLSETALLEWVRTQVGEFELREIAANDYGEEIPEHLAGIKAQLSETPDLGVLPWCPREVLELERWNEPDRSYDESPPKGRMGHLKRLLACTILLRNVAYIYNSDSPADNDTLFFIDTSALTVLRLAESAVSVGAEAIPLALSFVGWCHSQIDYPLLTPFLTFAVMLLVEAGNFEVLVDQNVEDLCGVLMDEEQRARLVLGEEVNTDKWLTGLNLYEKDREFSWRETTTKILVVSRESRSTRPKLAEVLKRLQY
jgi:hypothetical protein